MGGTPLVWAPCTGCTLFSRQSSGFHSPWVQIPVSQVGQHSSWGDIGKHEESTWRGETGAGHGAQLPQWGGVWLPLHPQPPGATSSLPPCQVKAASWEGPASDFGKRSRVMGLGKACLPCQLLGRCPWRRAVGSRGTHGLGHCQSPARCWTLPPDGFPRDPRGPLEEKPPLSPPLPPIRPMGPLGPLGPPGPPGPPGPAGRSPVSAGSHGRDGQQLWRGCTVPPRRGGGIPRCSRGGIPPLRLFIGPFFRARDTFSLLPWKSFPGRDTMAGASVNHVLASHTCTQVLPTPGMFGIPPQNVSKTHHQTIPRLFWQWMGHRRTQWHRPWACPFPCRCRGLSWAAPSSCLSKGQWNVTPVLSPHSPAGVYSVPLSSRSSFQGLQDRRRGPLVYQE